MHLKTVITAVCIIVRSVTITKVSYVVFFNVHAFISTKYTVMADKLRLTTNVPNLHD